MLLNTENGYILIKNGDFDILTDTLAEYTSIIKTLLLTVKGEYFLDTEYGISYFTKIFNKQSTAQLAFNIIQEELLKLDFVIKVSLTDSRVSRQDRKLYLSLSIQTDSGTVTTESIL